MYIMCIYIRSIYMKRSFHRSTSFLVLCLPPVLVTFLITLAYQGLFSNRLSPLFCLGHGIA